MTEPHPIRQRIRGIDSNYRDLNSEEIAQLTRPGPEPGRGDWFAQWLARVPVEQRQLSLRSFLTQALDPERGFYQSFAVADGTSIVYDRENEDNPLNSVSRHLRFVTIVLPDTRADRGALAQHAIKERTLCLVSSPDPDEVQAFFQCASWDPHAFGSNQGLMRFYEREAKRGWVFVGDSYHAFNSQTLNLGPFDGHIGGVMIMKELRRPWMHWFDITNVNEFQRSLGSTREAGSRADPNNALHDPLFAGPARAAFSLLGRAETLESVVTNSITRWYSSRFRRDFLEPGSTNPLPEITAQIKQWIAHILVNRSMNIVTSATSTAQVQMNADIGRVPITLFYNAKAFERLLPSVGGEAESITISNALYTAAVRKLGISIYYDPPGGDGSTGSGPYGTGPSDGSRRKIAVEHTEGPFPFPAIEPGIEDYQAIRTLLRPRPRLISEKGIAALLMVDFCNPMYSPRREELMEYLPKAAKYDPQSQSYDVLEQFIANVKQSPKSTDPESAEHEVLQLLETPDDTYVEVFTRRINDYIAKIRERVTNPNSAEAAVEDYMTLAEGRRRTYRRLENGKPDGTGLDEFVLTLPFAARPNPFPIMEMTETGEVRVMQGKSVYGVAAAKCPAMRGGAA